MISAGKKRVEVLKTRGYPVASLYGENLVGGLGRLYVLIEKPEAYGLPADPQYPALAGAWKNIVQPLGKIALGGTVLGTLVAWLVIRRKIRMEEVE